MPEPSSVRLRAVPVLAKRFLFSKQSDGFLSFITWVSIAGVLIGVFALTVVTSVINGFQGELEKVISGLNGDVVLYSRAEPVGDPEAIAAKIRKAVPQARAVAPSLITELMAAGPKGVAGVVLEGIDSAAAARVTSVSERIAAGRMPAAPGEVVIGQTVAERIGVEVGKEVRMVIPSVRRKADARGGAGDGIGAPKLVQAKCVGIVSLGFNQYDSKYLFGQLAWVQEIFGFEGRVSTFKVRLAPGADARAASDRLSEYFGYPFRAKSWGELNKNLLYAIELEKIVIAIILAAIILVAAFNVVSTLFMMIHDKTKEIAILKAMGFRPAQAFGLFVGLGMGIGIFGILLGLGIGLFVNFALAETKLIRLPAEIYYIGFLPVAINWSELGIIAIVSVAIVFVATLIPSVKVSTQSPMDGIRFQ